MLVLSAADVAELLPYEDCIAAVEAAFRAGGPVGALTLGHFHVKAAAMGRYYAAKVNGNFAGNVALPTIQGVLYLADASNGRPLAVMDSAEITKRRTAAATAVAARWLSRPDASSLTIIGCGAQAPAQLEALLAVRPIRRVGCVDIDPARSGRLADACARRGLTITDELGDIVVTCTTSREPVLDAVRPGTFVAAVGADHPEKRELSDRLMAAARIVTDVRAQALAFGELHHAPGDADELHDVFAGSAPGRTGDETIVFDSTGMALQDVAAAAVVYERAIARSPASRPRGRTAPVRL